MRCVSRVPSFAIINNSTNKGLCNRYAVPKSAADAALKPLLKYDLTFALGIRDYRAHYRLPAKFLTSD
jgi:hypothetical protein